MALFFSPWSRHTQVDAIAVITIANVELYAWTKDVGGAQTDANIKCRAMIPATAVSRLTVNPPTP
jgi:hypothetical protein